MPSLALVGSIAVELNNSVAVTAYDFNIRGTRPVQIKKGALGPIGAARGQEDITISLKFAVPDTGLEFDIVTLMRASTGFSINFPIGSERHAVYGCHISDRGLTNNPESGNTDFSLDCRGSEWIRTA